MAIFVVALTIAFGIYESANSFTVPIPHAEHQDCLDAAHNAGEKQPQCPTRETVWERGMRDPVAQYTLWITWFTGVLTILGLAQWVLTYRQIQLARDEFAAAPPPELFARDVQFSWVDGTPEATPIISFTLINRGRSPCTIVESVFQRKDDWPEVPVSFGINELGPIELAAGGYRSIQIPLLGDGAVFLVYSTGAGMYSDQFFIGIIVYADRDGVRRRLVFRRICKRGSLSGFEPTGNPHDEYND